MCCEPPWAPPPLHSIDNRSIDWYSWTQETSRRCREKNLKASIFVEVVRGCRQTTCAYQCGARLLPVEVADTSILRGVRELYDAAKGPYGSHFLFNSVILYGKGDPSLFDWEHADPLNVYSPRVGSMIGHLDSTTRAWTTLPAATSKKRILLIGKRHGCGVLLSVSTKEELDAALAVCTLISGIAVPGLKGVPLQSVLGVRDRFARVWIRGTAEGRPGYLSSEEFESAYGIRATPRTGCGFRPCIVGVKVHAKEVELSIKPCLGTDHTGTLRIRNGHLVGNWDILRLAAHKGLSCTDYATQKRWEWSQLNPYYGLEHGLT
jgi:hypothetical protein